MAVKTEIIYDRNLDRHYEVTYEEGDTYHPNFGIFFNPLMPFYTGTNSSGTGGPAVDQAARDAAAQAQNEVDTLEQTVADLPAAAVLDRDTVTLTTPSLAAGATHSAAVPLGETSVLQTLTVSQAARVQLYLTAAARTADAGRAFGADFGAQAPYILFDAQLPHEGALSVPVGLIASSPDGVFYALLTNTGAAAQVIRVDFERLVLEPESVN